MSRYLPHVRDAITDGKLPYIERLPNGTPREDGHTFDDAKVLFLEEMREIRDRWYLAAKQARRLTRDKLSIADVQEDGEAFYFVDGEVEEEAEEETDGEETAAESE